MGDRLGILSAVGQTFANQERQTKTFLYSSGEKFMPPVRLELTAFRLWDWRAAYCATEAILTMGNWGQILHHKTDIGKREKVSGVMRQPGIEPGSTAWKAAMLTTIPLTLTWGEDEEFASVSKTPWRGIDQKGHCRDQDSNLGYCGHNAGS